MKPSKEFSTRYSAAKRWRNGVEQDIKDVLRFCANGREKDFTTTARNETEQPSDIFIDIAEELATDLAGDLVTYFTPAEVRWAEYILTYRGDFTKQALKQIKADIQYREDILFEMIEASNYYDVAPQIMFETATHGTPAMWVQQSHITQPIYIETVPPHELLITPGHNGYLDRFREKWVLVDHLDTIFADENVYLDQPEIKKKKQRPGTRVKVCWGYWLDWKDPVYPRWRYEATVDGIRITDERQDIGPLEGSCPLLVGRFNPQPGRPWGRGPGRKALSTIFTADKISEVILTNLDHALDKSVVYPDDGVLDMSDGFKAGTAYPARPGSAEQVRMLDLSGNLDYGWFSEERMTERLRSAFYQDGPRQRGDTPPSATQWVDEARRVQRRIGKPSAPLWTEMIVPFIQRVEYIAVQTGKVPEAITHQGDKLTVKPISPLQKAQNQDKVLNARSNLELGLMMGGEQGIAGIGVDAAATYEAIVKASGDELIQFAEEEQSVPPPPAA